MFLKYGKIYWDLANLLVDSGLVGDKEKNPTYDKLARAMGNLKGTIVKPDINLSSMDFKINGDKILFGFRSMLGFDKSSYEIVEKFRPYTSLEDFVSKTYYKGGLTQLKIIVLIKSGAFDCFNPNRREVMMEFFRLSIPTPKTVTMAQYGAIKDKIKGFDDIRALYEFRQKLMDKKRKSIDKAMEVEFISRYSKYVDYKFGSNGQLMINKDSFEKHYNATIKPLQAHLKTIEIRELYANMKRNKLWKERCAGTVEKWEMESTLNYFGKSELETAPIDEYFDLDDFEQLPSDPEPAGFTRRGYPYYNLTTIAGTVVAKDKPKSTVFILTNTGIVALKYAKGNYAYYNESIMRGEEVIDKSWFERGEILIVTGYRLGTDFKVQSKKDSHSTIRVVKYNSERIIFQDTKKV